MPFRLGHRLNKKTDCLKNIFHCIYITIEVLDIELTDVSKQILQDLEKHEEEITEIKA